MMKTAGALSLFFKVVDGKLRAMTGAYVDDTIGTGDQEFEEESKITGERFQAKDHEVGSFQFAGIEIEQIENGYLMHQERFAIKISQLLKQGTFPEFRSKQQELAWLAHIRPDISAAVKLAAQVTASKFGRKDISALNKVIKRVHSTAKRWIRQQKLDSESLLLKLFTDSSFANTPELRSQLGFLVLLCDATNKCNILHFSSVKSKRASRLVIGSKVLAFADGFEYAYKLKIVLERVIGKNLLLAMHTNSESLFKTIVKSTTTTEKRLMIDIQAARNAYAKQEIGDVGWIRTEENQADGLTKSKPCSALVDIWKLRR